MTFLDASESLTIDDIKDVENELNVKFPEEFKEHYLVANGGCPQNDLFKWKEGGYTRVNNFSSMKYPGFDRIEDAYRSLVLDDSYLPVGIVPFASDDGGNFFCISVRPVDWNYVYYCNNDHYNSLNKEECLTRIDTSFKHFVDSLYHSD